MTYAYWRVSTTEQNEARQLKAFQGYTNKIDVVLGDKLSGKNFNRPEYQRMKTLLVSGDEVIVKSFDRLGRNKSEVKRELEWFKNEGVVVRILDVPTTMIDFKNQTWILEMVNNILIEVLGTIAEQERETIRQRQREGIDAMPMVNGKKISSKTGRPTGRPPKSVNYVLEDGETITDACARLGISRTQWYRATKQDRCTGQGNSDLVYQA